MEGSERRYVDNMIQFQGFGQRVNGLATAKEAYTARFLGHPLPVQMLSRSDARTEVFSKINAPVDCEPTSASRIRRPRKHGRTFSRQTPR